MTMPSSGQEPPHLDPSELGTKEYWNALYTRELTNHASNSTDIGTVWFDDSDAEAKMVHFLNQLPDQHDDDAFSKETTSFLDLGCGNGSMLFTLRENGWSGQALGVDYSPQSVQLARQVCVAKAEDVAQSGGEVLPPVRFAEWDIMNGSYETVRAHEIGSESENHEVWDIVLDKGTFDAVSLSEERTESGRRLCEVYPERVLPLLRKGGLFLITSCNWTEDELTKWFAVGSRDGEDGASREEGRFVPAGRVQYRTFSFGGVKGQTISTLCFRKV
ncbi:hypothetical protein E4U57_005129 [Claviceps arundinis]|uniref:Protein-lysine N-methyltransferase EFM4 n=1 Tax=Claviceps arundinis TaxID=1623583 RepID=A0A9P7N2Q2_9HYPO|nr:hypothetical protein E4U57_005129 [Claviceps arundinis]KAG5978211.1 hypothetical protein E4U56_004553 [Claviceps arundinis]